MLAKHKTMPSTIDVRTFRRVGERRNADPHRSAIALMSTST